MSSGTKTIPVKQRALVARLTRALAKQGRQLRTDRRERDVRWLLIDTAKDTLLQTDVDLEALSRELGVLKRWEKLDA